MDQEREHYAEPENSRRLPPSFWITALVVVMIVSSFLAGFFGDEIDEWLGTVGLRKVRD